jgi:cytoskeletal protein CcmA (bactofilin family)
VLSSSAIFAADPGERRNLIVEGRIDAEVPLRAHGVAIGAMGRVRGDIHAATIRVEGEVIGNLFGEVEVRVCSSAKVRGDITAPNVILEEGARFKGRVAMEEPEPFLEPEPGGESPAALNA